MSEYTKIPGKTGIAAKVVAELLHPHFIKEETFAMPPLALLSLLAKGEAAADEAAVISITEKLKADLPEMLEEHAHIVKALEKLNQAARDEKHPEVMRFADKLQLHAQTEEEVLYPAAILVGEYLKIRDLGFRQSHPTGNKQKLNYERL